MTGGVINQALPMIASQTIVPDKIAVVKTIHATKRIVRILRGLVSAERYSSVIGKRASPRDVRVTAAG